MKRIVIFLILVAASARLKAHAFLKNADPGVGSTIETSPSEVQIRFTEKIEPAVSSIQASTRLGKKWTNAICIWIAPTTHWCTFLSRNSAQEYIKSCGAWFLLTHT